MTEHTPSPEALEAASIWLKAVDDSGETTFETSLALALDRFAERRVREELDEVRAAAAQEINRLRRRVNDYHAWIASLDTGAHLDPPEPEDG